MRTSSTRRSGMIVRFGIATLACFGLACSSTHATVATQAAYEWSNVRIIGGGFVTGIIYHPTARDVVYARTDMGGAYRFDEPSQKWVPLTDFLTDYQQLGIETLALDAQNPDRVYLAIGSEAAAWAGNGEFLRSNDRGATWERFPLPFKCAANWGGRSIGERLAVDPNNADTLFFASRYAGLWRSNDRGTIWQKVDSFEVNVDDKPANLGIVLFDATSSQPGRPTPTLYVATTTQTTLPSIYRSDDHGATWTPLEGQPPALVPHHMKLAADGTLYITYSNKDGPNGIGDGAVWKRSPDGVWTDITPVRPRVNGEQGFGYAGLALDPHDPQIVVVSSICRWAAKDDLWRTTDGGATWRSVYHTAEIDKSLAPFTNRAHWMGDVEIDPHRSDRLMFTTGNGIMRTDNLSAVDRGEPARFVIGADGIEEVAVLDLISPPEGAHLLSAMRDIGGFRHEDLSVSPPSGDYKNPRVGQVNALDFAELRPELVVRGNRGNEYLALSTDNGVSWAPIPLPPTNGRVIHASDVALTADGSALLVKPADQPVFVTIDRGSTWQLAQGLPPETRHVWSDRVDPHIVYALSINVPRAPRDAQRNTTNETLPAGSKTIEFYRSVDGGATFTPAALLPGVDHLRNPRAVFGQAGHSWVPADRWGLWRTNDAFNTIEKVAGVTTAESVGFGKAAPGSDYPTIFMTGVINGWYGVYRSTDAGRTWVRLNDGGNRWGNLCFATVGDPRIFGRVYIGTNGRGIIMGEPASSDSPR